ncbi:MAG: hypothetical protein KKF42_09010 [Actinobacteria bacterium]|nr:hypothetical protein [Actinomycetota bacterium]
MKNITICLKPETIKQFKELATLKGYSISGWINAKMEEEITKTKTVEEQKLFALLCKLTKEELNKLYELYL